MDLSRPLRDFDKAGTGDPAIQAGAQTSARGTVFPLNRAAAFRVDWPVAVNIDAAKVSFEPQVARQPGPPAPSPLSHRNPNMSTMFLIEPSD